MGETEGMKSSLAVVALLLVSACGSDSEPSAGGSSSPAEPTESQSAAPARAVERLVASLEAGSCEDVKTIVVTPSLVDCEVIESLGGSFADQGVALDDVTYSVDEIEGDSGTVAVDWGTGEADESWQVERIDGEWKVIFDSVE
jgi:hypothetical protein